MMLEQLGQALQPCLFSHSGENLTLPQLRFPFLRPCLSPFEQPIVEM